MLTGNCQHWHGLLGYVEVPSEYQTLSPDGVKLCPAESECLGHYDLDSAAGGNAALPWAGLDDLLCPHAAVDRPHQPNQVANVHSQ